VHYIAWIILGGLAGWVAGKLMSGHGYGVVMDIVLGIVGAFIGGFLIRTLLGVSTTNLIISFIGAVIGACILVAIIHMVRREPLRT
jgi:uncharacterized membrane protein YeaQ/YmgE (transglycosylase-associated protein family)